MPIEIVNVTPEVGDDGYSRYEVRINGAVKGIFEHYRPSGLALCLFLASRSVANPLPNKEDGSD